MRLLFTKWRRVVVPFFSLLLLLGAGQLPTLGQQIQGAAAAAPTAATGRPMREALTPAGTLRPGATGSFDATGYQMGTVPVPVLLRRRAAAHSPAPGRCRVLPANRIQFVFQFFSTPNSSPMKKFFFPLLLAAGIAVVGVLCWACGYALAGPG